MPAVDETEVDIALTKNSLEKNDMVGEEKRKVTNNHLLVTFFFVMAGLTGHLFYVRAGRAPSC